MRTQHADDAPVGEPHDRGLLVVDDARRVERHRGVVLPVETAVVGTEQRGARRLVLALLAVPGIRPYTPSSSESFGISHAPSRQPACLRAALHRHRIAPGRAAVRRAQHVGPEPTHGLVAPRPVAVFVAHRTACPRGLLGTDPALEVRRDREVDEQRAVRELQIPQSQLPVSSVYGSTTVRSVHVSPPSRERGNTVWPLSWWYGKRSSLYTATRSPDRRRRTFTWLYACARWRRCRPRGARRR